MKDACFDVERHFVQVPYQKKMKIIVRARNTVQTGTLLIFLHSGC